MAEQSFIFDFTRTDDFFEQFNKKFDLDDMFKVVSYDEDDGYTYEDDDVDDNFELVLVFYGGTNISDYLDSSASYSKLKSSLSSYMQVEEVALDWYNRGNGEATIELHGEVTFSIGDDNKPLKAVFLRTNDTDKYVMGYSINTNPFSVTNEVVFDDDVIFWDISRL